MNKLTLSALLMVLTLGLAACSSEEEDESALDQAAGNTEEMAESAEEASDSIEEGYNGTTN